MLGKIWAFYKQHMSKPQLWSDEQYREWIRESEPALFSSSANNTIYPYQPKISVIIPVYNTARDILEKCFESVVHQTYSNWEVCAVDDHSTKNVEAIRELFESYRRSFPHQFKLTFSKENRNISGNTNECVKLADGEFLMLLDNDDELSPYALHEFVIRLNEDADLDVIYGDEDYLNEAGERTEPFFRPDYSPDYLRCTMYMAHFLVRKSMYEAVGGMRKGFEGPQDWDLMLRISQKTEKIGHIPKILYHWRKSATSTAAILENKPYVIDRMKKTLEEYSVTLPEVREIEPGIWSGSFIFRYKHTTPKVSVIIPNKNNFKMLKTCVESLYHVNSYKKFDVIIVENGSTEPALLSYYEELQNLHKAKIVTYPESQFNYSKAINLGVANSTGEVLLLFNNDVECITPEAMEYMIENAVRKDIGAVGAKLLYPNSTIQHAGVTLEFETSKNGYAGETDLKIRHEYAGLPKYSHGGSGAPLNSVRNPIAVTAACIMVERMKFEKAGGFNEEYIIAYQDIASCLQLSKAGYRTLYHPKAVWRHHESVTRKTDSVNDYQVRDFGLLKKLILTMM